MTREESIEHIKDIICENNTVKHSDMVVFENEKEALRMAIQALSQKPCEQCEGGNPCLYCVYEFKDKRVEQMCKDCTHAGVYGANSMKCTLRDEIVFNDGRCNSFEPKVAHPCDDAISREAVLDTTICEGISCNECSFNEINGESGCLLHARIDELPSVTQKSGKWIEHPEIETSTPEYLMFYECSECGNKQCFCKSDIHKKRFCSNCGAKIESEE